MFGSKFRIGYCANVHSGRDLDEVKSNLNTYALKIREKLHPKQKMGIGLWLSATTLEQLDNQTAIDEFEIWLSERGLVPFTFNGFPFGDFHQDVVKHNVYLPTWADSSRLNYTSRLSEVLRGLLTEELESTISTVPIGWPSSNSEKDQQTKKLAAKNLRQVAQNLYQTRKSTGHVSRVAIEPEPGCLLDTAEDVIEFFNQDLLTGNSATDDIIRNHITVCHDVCHSAVMFESQQHAIESYRNHGIRIGKVQVSSAVEVDFTKLDADEKKAAFDQLKDFNEPRYLHQTCIQSDDGKVAFFEDLSLAIASAVEDPTGTWRVHFHVPIFAKQLNAISTTQHEIVQCLQHLDGDVKDFEVETYAWNVLPESQRNDSLIDGIAKELQWFYDLVN